MAPCNLSEKKQKIISDLEDLINCIKIGPSEKSSSKKKNSLRKNGNGKKKSSEECGGDDWKKDRYKSRELRMGVLYTGCLCTRRNGLQQDCLRSDCQGRPPCLVKPWADCLPSGGSGLKGAEPKKSKYPYAPAGCIPGSSDELPVGGASRPYTSPCPAVPDFPPGVRPDPCHRAEVDCPKCEPVVMCRPGAARGEEERCPRAATAPCRPAEPQPEQMTVHSPCDGRAKCDPPTHVVKQPAYADPAPPPNCVRPKTIHHPAGKILPDVSQLQSGKLFKVCDCLKTNGLQDECRLPGCGIPECLLRPPQCVPAGGRGPRPLRADGGHGDAHVKPKTAPAAMQLPHGMKTFVCYLPDGDGDDGEGEDVKPTLPTCPTEPKVWAHPWAKQPDVDKLPCKICGRTDCFWHPFEYVYKRSNNFDLYSQWWF